MPGMALAGWLVLYNDEERRGRFITEMGYAIIYWLLYTFVGTLGNGGTTVEQLTL